MPVLVRRTRWRNPSWANALWRAALLGAILVGVGMMPRAARADGRFEEVGYTGGQFNAVTERGGLMYVAQGDALVIADMSELADGNYRGRLRPGVTVMVDVALSGQSAIVAAGDDGLLMVDVSSPEAPRLRIRRPVGGFAASVVVQADKAFLAAGSAGLVVVDIADLDRPRILGAVPTMAPAIRLAAAGDYAYVVSRGGLQVFDVGDPAAPRETWRLARAASDIAAHGSRLHLATDWEVFTLDLSDPAQPRQVSRVPSWLTRAVAVAGDWLWLVRYGYDSGWYPELAAVDLTDPDRLVERGSVKLRSSISRGTGPWFRMTVLGPRAWVASGSEELWVLDVSAPGQPVVADQVFSATGGSVVVSGGRGIQGQPGGCALIDVSDPSRPRVRELWPAKKLCAGAAIAGTHALVPNWTGVVVVDIRDLHDPEQLAAATDIPSAETVAATGDHAYIAQQGSRVWSLDLSNPRRPRVTGSTSVPYTPFRFAVAGSHLYGAMGRSGLASLDISDPDAPRLEDTLPLHDFMAVDVAVDGDQVVVGSPEHDDIWTDSGRSIHRIATTWVVDAMRPGALCRAAFYDPSRDGRMMEGSGATGLLALLGRRAFIALGRQGLQVLDTSEMERLVEVGVWQPGSTVIDVKVDGGLLFATTQASATESWPTGLSAPGGLHVLRWVEGNAVQRTGAPMQAPLSLRQSLPFRVFLSGLFLQRCR